jgi:transposase-like protein
MQTAEVGHNRRKLVFGGYLRFKLSFRDLVEMMAERGISLAHTTIMRWIARYVPDFERRWNRFICRAGASRRVDEAYVKIKGRWT